MSPGRTRARSVARAARRTSRWPWPRQTGPLPSSRGSGSSTRRGEPRRGGGSPCHREPVGNGHGRREYAGHGAVLEDSRRKPGRDRNRIFRTLRSWRSSRLRSTRSPTGTPSTFRSRPRPTCSGRRTDRELPESGSNPRGSAARRQAIHPGYGFLAENAGFARACAEAGLTWIGPPPEAIEAMGSKVAARETMRAAGVPIVPGTTEAVTSAADVVKLGDELGWPLAIKASAGGGGKGLKVVRRADDAERAFEAARREGEAYFSDPAVYVERYLEDPRHVEVQGAGRRAWQRHSPRRARLHHQRRTRSWSRRRLRLRSTAALRERIGQIAVDAARAVGYRNAGTIEGLLDQGQLLPRMNTRIQVEHTVTERHRARPRPRAGADRGRRAAIAEPGSGPPAKARHRVPHQRGGREHRLPPDPGADHVLSGTGWAWCACRLGGDRGQRGRRALRPACCQALCPRRRPRTCETPDAEGARRVRDRGSDDAAWLPSSVARATASRGETCHGVVESEELAERAQQLSHQTTSVRPSSDGVAGRRRREIVQAEVDGRRFEVKLLTPEPLHADLVRRRQERDTGRRHHGAARDAIVSPMRGTVLAVEVADGDEVVTVRWSASSRP